MNEEKPNTDDITSLLNTGLRLGIALHGGDLEYINMLKSYGFTDDDINEVKQEISEQK